MDLTVVVLFARALMYCIYSVQSNDNIALSKTTKQSSIEVYQGNVLTNRGPHVAVDGYIYPTRVGDQMKMSHTNAGDFMPWWAVDLGQHYYVSVITVYGRDDGCCLNQVSKMTIDVIRPTKCSCDEWEALQTGHVTSCHYQEMGVMILNISCPSDTIGRFVRIRRNGELMSLAEVQVYGDLLLGVQNNKYSACRLNSVTYTGYLTTTQARSNVECVQKCVTTTTPCKVAEYRKASKTCIHAMQCSVNATTRSDNLTGTIFLIEKYF